MQYGRPWATPCSGSPASLASSVLHGSLARTGMHPRFRAASPPVILIGMHRSGTSLVAAMLSRLGIHMGQDCQLPGEEGADLSAMARAGYGESTAFRRCNDQLLQSQRSAWDQPETYLRARCRGLEPEREALRLSLATHGFLRSAYGLPPAGGGQGEEASVWGWKDPRTSLTLPVWLELFPTARVLYVRRKPEAAARSLHQRALFQAEEALNRPRLRPAQRAVWALTHPVQALRCVRGKLGPRDGGEPVPSVTDFERCLELAHLYQAECGRHLAGVRQSREIHYEEVLADPCATAQELAAFCGVAVPRARLQAAAALVQH